MIDVTPYLDKLELLKVWMCMWVDERELRRWQMEIFLTTGVFLSPIYETPTFEEFYQGRMLLK